MNIVTVHFSLHLPAKVKRKRKWFVASCPILDIYSQGDTEEQARKNLAEALTLFFISCHERGTLDAVLRESGFTSFHPSGKTKVIPESEYINVPIPFYVNLNGPRQRRCHA